MSKTSDHTGKIFNNNVLVIRLLDEKYGKFKTLLWECKCLICNKIFECPALKLVIRKSCGCLHLRSGKNSPIYKGCGEIGMFLFTCYKKSAKARNIKFNITIEEMWNLFLEQDRKCALSGVDLFFKKSHKHESNASLDRIDSSKEYVVDNVQWVHKDINFMKQSYEQSYFIEMCKNITTNQQIEKY